MRQKRDSPLYSPVGCGTTIVLIMVLGAILWFRGGGPFSPGPLSAANPREEPLSGFASHADFEEECAMCHASWHGATADRCESCHTDVAGQRIGDFGLHGRLPDTSQCQQCHTDHQGREADLTHFDLASFEHDWLTDFSLFLHETDFDETPIVCLDCHPQKDYLAMTINCVECHQMADPIFTANHRGQFGEECQACHDGQDSMASFEHQAVFPLDGAHTSIDCADCHVQSILDGTPDECAGCHAEPAIHAGSFGQDCLRCHTTATWLPAQLTYHTFPLNHGDEGKIGCQTCHDQDYTGYTCTNCHAHVPGEIRQTHLEIDINDFDDCIACHPTGRADEVEEAEDA
jgi:ssDNA-binding Zn-finger/Zn-ribbon topoisomerase 1